MSMPLIISLSVALVVLSVVAFLYFRNFERTANNNIDQLAKKHGFTFERGTFTVEPSLHGNYRGIPLVVQSVVASSGSVIMYTTTYTATLTGTHIPMDLVVYREGLWAKVGKAFGAEDIQLDDPDFDNKFIIKGSAHHDARMFFARPDVKNCFLEMAHEGDNFRLENKTLFFDLPHRMIEQGDALISHMDQVVAYANTLNNSVGTPSSSSQTDPTDLLRDSTPLEAPIPHEIDVAT